MARGARHRHIGFLGQALHGTLPLRKQIEKLKAVGISQRFANTSELLKQLILKSSVSTHLFNILVE